MLTINLEWDPDALEAPQSFRNGVQTAADILEAAIYDPITVNIQVGYGEYDDDGPEYTPLTNYSLGGILSVIPISYAPLKLALQNAATSSGEIEAVNSLPNTAALNGLSDFFISSAEAKALGAISATAPGVDGDIGFPTSFTGNGLVDTAIAELAHAMGLLNGGGVETLVEYTSPGNHLLTGDVPTAPAYFSIDGGNTNLANFDVSFDSTLFENQSNDPLNVPSDGSTLTSLDLTLLSVLGFDVAATPSLPTPSIIPTVTSADDSATVNIENATDIENGTIPALSFIASVSVPAGDSIAGYAFYDQGGDDGHFAVGGIAEPDNQWIYVLDTQLSSLQYVGGPSAGSDQIEVYAIDTNDASAPVSQLTVTTIPPPPVIAGTVAGQKTPDDATLSPFSAVTISDPNAGQTETVTVTLSAAANGTLSNLDGGSYNSTTGVYADAGSAAAVTAALDGLVFTPAEAPVPGESVTTTFTIDVTDSAGGSAADSTTSVVATETVLQLHAASTQYVIADDDGSVYIEDIGAGGDGTHAWPGVTEMVFTDGIGFFDPTGTAEEVARLYGAALDRAPDVPGLQYWTGQVDDSNVPLADVANVFATSPEFISDYGSLTDAQYVNQLYLNVLGRAADPGGLAYWEGVLAGGASRGQVLLGFADSQEYEADTQSISAGSPLFAAGDPDNAEVYRLYEATLGRAPDPAGQAYWAAQLASGVAPVQIAQGLVSSAEFQSDYGNLTPSEFIAALYDNVLHRVPDPAGLAYWTNSLNQGASEASVVIGFSDSLENLIDTASATHDNWVFVPS